MNNFYLNRLRSISLAELPYRIRQIIAMQFEEYASPPKMHDSIQLESTPAILTPELDKCESSSKPLSVFGRPFDFTNIQPIDWHRDIFSGKHFPLTFSKKINIRKDPDLSAKCVWEINRLQFLVQIAIKYHQYKNEIELNQFIKINRSWKEHNPYLKGINWYSNIEVNLRLITWFLCWELLDADKLMKQHGNFSLFTTKDWIPLIYQHCVYSYKNPSKFSSANNHLISEYAGLFIASSKWAFKESPKWVLYAKKGLETEMMKQHSKKGINKEEAAEYIQFITDFLLLAYIVAENTHNPFSGKYKDRLHHILKYICSFLDRNGNFPKYGDEDDGKCILVDHSERFNNFKSLLTSGAVIFKDPLLKSKSNGFDLKNQLLFGEDGKKIFNSVPDNVGKEESEFFKEEGHFVLRAMNRDEEVLIHFDSAPLGFLSIAAHGHADALSFLLNVDGQPIFVDPGTYTYHTQPKWRNYFIGTLAHNTIRINKLDQAKIAGSTLWLQHYKCKILHTETNTHRDVIRATHNGYKKYGITHKRELIFDKIRLEIRILDIIETKMQLTSSLEMSFHLHPEIKITATNCHRFSLKNKNGQGVILQTDQKLNTTIVCGQTEPEIVGWYSKSFMHKEPTNTIICSQVISGSIQFETTISIN